MTSPRSIGVGMRIRLLRRGITVPTHRAHIARGRRLADLLIRPILAREAMTPALRQTAASVQEHSHAQEHKPYGDGRDDYNRDLLFQRRVFGLVESDAAEIGLGRGGVRRGKKLYVWRGGIARVSVYKVTIVNEHVHIPDCIVAF